MRAYATLTACTAALAAVLLLPANGHGKTAASDKADPGATQFLKEAASGGMAEVKLGGLAEQRAASDDVKNFGKRMVNDHTKANEDLKRVAAEKNVTLPSDVDHKDKEVYDRLSKLSGKAFDRAYMDLMVKDHEQDVAEFEKAARSKDPAVQAFAERTLPTLKDHLTDAQQIAASGGERPGAHPTAH